MRWTYIFLLCWFMAVTSSAPGADWPSWLGANHDSVWRETDIVREIPADGLPIKWRTAVNYGYSGPAVADGRVYLMDYVLESGKITNNPGGRDKTQGKERVLCLGAETGEVVWKYAYDCPYQISYGGGPRCTPTISDGKVYALGAEGNLSCLDAESGSVIWTIDFAEKYGSKTPMWGVAAHPLVVDDTVYCVAGGEGSVAVALNKRTGEEIWRALSAREPGYCPPAMIEHAGARQLLIWHAESLNSLDPASGKLHWSLPLRPKFGMAIAMPRKSGKNLLASNYGVAALLKLKEGQPGAEIAWRGQPKNAVYAANVTPFIDGDTVYGCDIETGALMGVDLETRERLWQTFVPTFGGDRRERYGTAFIVKNEDRFVLFNELGDLILAHLSREGYDEVGRFHVLEPTSNTFGRPVVWSHPAFANRCVFARNDREIVCVDMADRSAP